MSPPHPANPAGVPGADERVLILDYGSQYTQLIARRVRELGVYAEIHPGDWDGGAIAAFAPRAIILSGGPASVLDEGSLRIPEAVFALGVPLLGICYGMQALALQLGGEVEEGWPREYGSAEVALRSSSPLFNGIQDGSGRLSVWMSHGIRVKKLPPGFVLLAGNASTPIAAIADEVRHWYGIQFHPEVRHTPSGTQLIMNFLREIAGLGNGWHMDRFEETACRSLRAELPSGRVLVALSGGVDSAVLAALLARAIGDRLAPILVDTGLLREGEVAGIREAFADFPFTLRIVDAEARFFAALAGVSDPEEKRRRIGGLFIDVFTEEARKLPDIRYLAQGTIYPDVIESAGSGGSAQIIKSHHNVGGLPDRLPFPLVEPLRFLFKDEVRALGRTLGLPARLVERQPFPGPGLAVRVLGPVTRESVRLLRHSDRIFLEELETSGYLNQTSQAFAVLLPVCSVAVKGDGRAYEPVVALRAVVTEDFMTAHAAPLSVDFLARIANRITNEVPGISRVVYDITGKPPATIEWE
ncbi:MAG: glutamine-hydrolyzing GMP synthase [Gammaproteobacteria bacterium]